MVIGSNTSVSLAPGVISSQVADELVLLNVQTGIYAGVDGVGAHIVGLLQTCRRVDDIVDHVLAHFDGDAAVIRRDVVAFLDSLAEKNIVVESP